MADSSKTPTEALKAKVLDTCYHRTGYTAIQSNSYLAARHKLKVGIFVIDGTFTRDDYKECKAQAKAAGLRTDRICVYARLVAYTGSDIDSAKFNEIGIDPDSIATEQLLTPA